MTGKGEQMPKRKQHSDVTEVFCCNVNFVILFTDNILLLGEGFLECILITNKNPFLAYLS